MAYKIKDIDWSEMPAGAVEFSLENEEYLFTWYDKGDNFWNYIEQAWWPTRRFDIGRKRYKVSNYHPSTVTNRKPTREERLDKALRALIQTHFFGDGLEWSWREGNSLEEMDPSLYKEIVDLLKNEEG